MGIQAIKGVEVGDGFELARSRGSAAHDEIVPGEQGIARASHRSGGTEGGMSTGEVLRVRAAMKPISTVPRALRTVDVATGEAAVAHHQRSTSAPYRRPGWLPRRWLPRARQRGTGEIRRRLGGRSQAQLRELSQAAGGSGTSGAAPAMSIHQSRTLSCRRPIVLSVHPAPARALLEPCSPNGSALPSAMPTP